MPQCDWVQSVQSYQCRSTKFKSCLTSLAVLCDKTSRFVGEGRAVAKQLLAFTLTSSWLSTVPPKYSCIKIAMLWYNWMQN